MRQLSRDDLRSLLQQLSDRLTAQGIRADLFIVGGAAMALAYNTRRATVDIDAVFEPKTRVYEAAAEVAADNDLPNDWLNDAVKGLLPGADADAVDIMDLPGLRVQVASPRYLLALKVAAARVDRDSDDIQVLAGLCGLTSADEILQVTADVIGSTMHIPAKAQFLVQALYPADESGSPPKSSTD